MGINLTLADFAYMLRWETIRYGDVQPGMVIEQHDRPFVVNRVEIQADGKVSIFDVDDNGAVGIDPTWECSVLPASSLRKDVMSVYARS